MYFDKVQNMTIEQISCLIQQKIENLKYIKLNTYGSSLEPLRTDTSTLFICRENITMAFTSNYDYVHEHAFLFTGELVVSDNGNDPITYKVLRGKAQFHIGDRVVILRRGESFTVKPGETLKVVQAGREPFEFSGKLPSGFDALKVPGNNVYKSQLPDIAKEPFNGPFNYANK